MAGGAGSTHGDGLPAGRPLDALGVALAIVTCIVWGSNGVGTRIWVATLPPLTLGALRAWLAFAILCGVMLALGARFPRDPRAWRRAAVIGVLQTTVPVGVIGWAVLRVDAGLAMVIMSAQPFFVTLLLLHPAFGERLTPMRLVALVLGFAGVALVAYAKSGLSLHFEPVGLVVLGASSFCWALATVLLRRPSPEWPDTTTLVAGQMACGAVVLSLLAPLEWGGPMAVTPTTVATLLYLALCTTALTFLLWTWLNRRHGAGRVSAFVFVMPIAGVVLGALVLGEPVPALLPPGLALVALSLVLVSLPEGVLRRARG